MTSSWQRFTIVFPADTSNNIATGNGEGLRILWHLSAGPDDIASAVTSWTSSNGNHAVTGQSNFMDNTSNEFYLTGVQLEVGDTATSFEHRSVGDEMLRCKRYFQPFIQYAEYVSGGTGNLGFPYTAFTVPMRASPTFVSDHESKSSNWSFASMQVQGSDLYGYYAYAISYNTTNSNYGYMRKYGKASAEL